MANATRNKRNVSVMREAKFVSYYVLGILRSITIHILGIPSFLRTLQRSKIGIPII